MNEGFKIGDKVSRLSNVYDRKSKIMFGTVIRRYEETSPATGYFYPELYDVHWDDLGIRKGYFRTGLDKVE